MSSVATPYSATVLRTWDVPGGTGVRVRCPFGCQFEHEHTGVWPRQFDRPSREVLAPCSVPDSGHMRTYAVDPQSARAVAEQAGLLQARTPRKRGRR